MAEQVNIFESSHFRKPGEIIDVNTVRVCWTWKYPNHSENKSESKVLTNPESFSNTFH